MNEAKTHKDIKNWEDVEREIVRAIKTHDAMPTPRPRGYYSCWPLMIAEGNSEPEDKERFQPLASDIAQMDYIYENWMRRFDIDERKLVELRCGGMGWKSIPRRMLSRRHPRIPAESSVKRWYREALEKIIRLYDYIPDFDI